MIFLAAVILFFIVPTIAFIMAWFEENSFKQALLSFIIILAIQFIGFGVKTIMTTKKSDCCQMEIKDQYSIDGTDWYDIYSGKDPKINKIYTRQVYVCGEEVYAGYIIPLIYLDDSHGWVPETL